LTVEPAAKIRVALAVFKRVIMRIHTLLVIVALLSVASSTAAQQTRQDVLLKQREEKAGRLAPYKPGKLERLADKMEDQRMYERLFFGSSGGSGVFFPYFGSLEPGSGFAIGPSYRNQRLFGDEATLRIWAAASLRKYWKTEARLTFPRLAGGRLFAEVFANRSELPQKDYFGLGPDSLRENRSDFALRNTSVGGSFGARAGYLTAGIGLESLTPSVGLGKSTRVPHTHDLFTDADTPGLSEQPDFLHYQAFAEFNNRSPQRNPRAGGRYRLEYHRYNDRDLDRYSYDRVDLDVQHYIPFLNQKRVIALRALISTSHTNDGNAVPFYLQRTLGGTNTLRGFRNYRFRDRNLLLLQAEYRWEIFPALDAALFYDTGKVVPEPGDLDLDHLEHDYGFGFRFGTINGVIMRIDSAFGSADGKHFRMGFSHVF
jgi:outer membrane protein assembly factor BamA